VDTCSYAAWGGHLNILKWARERKGLRRLDDDEPLSEATAVRKRANGCSWNEATRTFAADLYFCC